MRAVAAPAAMIFGRSHRSAQGDGPTLRSIRPTRTMLRSHPRYQPRCGTVKALAFVFRQACGAVVANLELAKFPHNRLMGVVHPFRGDPARYLLPKAKVLTALGSSSVVYWPPESRQTCTWPFASENPPRSGPMS